MLLDRIRLAALVLAALPMALIAGFFYAYACSVMLGLARLDAAGFIAAMQAINDTVRNPVFFFSFFGALGLTVVAALCSLPRWGSPATWLVGVPFLVYALGAFGVTVACNVPLNEALAQVRVADPATDLDAARRAYEGPWVRWNLVRTLASTVALLALCGALALAGREAHAQGAAHRSLAPGAGQAAHPAGAAAPTPR